MDDTVSAPARELAEEALGGAIPAAKLIAGYIRLRDKKDALKKEYEAATERINALMEKIENSLLKHLQAIGGDSLKTPAGTVYKQTKSSCTVADKDAFLAFAQESGVWSILDVRASKTGVQQYREEHDDLPPGVNWTEVVVVNVRRS